MYKDQLNRTLQFTTTPKRIVSLVPSLTELICDLGLEAYLVGVTKFCVHPQHIRTKVILVDGELFSWYGSRLIKAFDYFKKLHQEYLN
jgi:ABC-type Fe3+-hydroxamate transport system substrate-binding protein